MRVLRILRLAKIHEYQRMSKLPTNIIFYHFKHLKKDILCQNYTVITKLTGTVQRYRLQWRECHLCGWQVTLYDPIWHVSYRSGVAG